VCDEAAVFEAEAALEQERREGASHTGGSGQRDKTPLTEVILSVRVVDLLDGPPIFGGQQET
jgi:hypothetical protein